MSSTNRFRLPAIACAVAFLLCELVARPFAEIGICDDWSYILTSEILARTGHIAFNGWASAMLGWQLYLAAAFVRLFGASDTSVRMSTLLVGVVTTFLVQRIFVRSGITERNASLATLALVLAPLYMQLSVTFMTDIQGLFAIAICLYGCMRALQTTSPGSSAAWVSFAALANAVCGTSRQVAWLGVLVMVPSTLFLLFRTTLRGRKPLLAAAAAAMLLGWATVLGCMHWFQLQPYSLPEHLFAGITGPSKFLYMARQMLRAVFELPLLTLAVLIAFLPELRRASRRFQITAAACTLLYLVGGLLVAARLPNKSIFQPLLGDWLAPQGFYAPSFQSGSSPMVLTTFPRLVLSLISLVGLLAFFALLARLRREPAARTSGTPLAGLSWRELAVLLGPFALAYLALLVPRSASNLYDRYLVPLTMLALLCLVRLFQQFVRPELPALSYAVVAIVALYSIGSVHDLFESARTRLALTSEMRAAGVPATAIDAGFEFDGQTELDQAGYIDDPRLINPPGSYHPVPSHRGWTCTGKEETDPALPHFAPIYGLAFTPDACRGPAPFAPVTYFRWLGLRPQTVYAVKYGP